MKTTNDATTTDTTTDTAAEFRAANGKDAVVTHMMFVRGLLCRSKRAANAQASNRRKDVSCLRCLQALKSITGR